MNRLLLTICCAALVLMAQPTHAATIAPSLLEVSGYRGEVVEKQFRVINTGAVEQTYHLGVMKFSANNEGSTPQFIPYDQDHSGLPEWVQFRTKKILVPANAYLEVPFQIVIPDDVASGGYYAGIMVASAPSEIVATNGAIIEAKTALLVLLTVTGETDDTWGLLDFVDNGSGVRSAIAGHYTYRVQNQGNIHVTPEGLVRLTDLFGRVLLHMDANQVQGRVLPGTTRNFSVQKESMGGFWRQAFEQANQFALGPVYVEVDLAFADQRYSERMLSFWYVPWQLLSVGFIILILIVLVYRGARR